MEKLGRTPEGTSTDNSLQVPFEMNTRSKMSPTTFITQIEITGADYRLIKAYFHVVPRTILCYDPKTILPQCMICKRIHFDVCIT